MGAFLRRSDAAAGADVAVGGLTLEPELHFNENGEVVADAAEDAAASLHEVGTFAQARSCQLRGSFHTMHGAGVLPLADGTIFLH